LTVAKTPDEPPVKTETEPQTEAATEPAKTPAPEPAKTAETEKTVEAERPSLAAASATVPQAPIPAASAAKKPQPKKQLSPYKTRTTDEAGVSANKGHSKALSRAAMPLKAISRPPRNRLKTRPLRL